MGRRRQRRGRRALLLLALLLLAAAAAYAYAGELAPGPAREPPPPGGGTLRVHYVQVGQGDGTIWELPDGSIVIYDCGPPAGSARENAMVRYLQDELQRAPGARLHALVASHGHLDHIGGCEEIFDLYEVARVYDQGYQGDDAPESYHRFRREIAAEGATVHELPEVAPGVALELPSASARFLWPVGFAPGGWDAIAEASLVVRLEHGASSFCFQGDIELAQEARLTGECDVYLVGHHGSRYASGAAWLGRMAPAIAVVSFGDNPYGHPHPEALCRVQAAGATLYATHRDSVVIESDGEQLRVLRGQAETRDLCAPGASYW